MTNLKIPQSIGSEEFFKKAILRNFAKFTGNVLCRVLQACSYSKTPPGHYFHTDLIFCNISSYQNLDSGRAFVLLKTSQTKF